MAEVDRDVLRLDQRGQHVDHVVGLGEPDQLLEIREAAGASAAHQVARMGCAGAGLDHQRAEPEFDVPLTRAARAA